jgi:DNA polymerase-3 subunit epsilon
MNLKLTKALAVIDLETTGLDVANDRIIEISVLKIEVNGNRNSLTRRVNPEIVISAESTAIHGISNEDVANEPNFKVVGAEIKQFIGNADFAGFNSNKFDIPMLAEEFLRNDIDFDMSHRKFIDVQNIFHKMEKRTLEAAYKFYCNKEIVNAHSAEADVLATYEVLEAQLERYAELEKTAAFLHEFSSMKNNVDLAGRIVLNEKGIEVFNFGKHKGRSVVEIFEQDPSYYGWMMKADFTMDTKNALTKIRLKQKTSSE